MKLLNLKRSKEAGFSMIELVVVIIIIGIISAIAIPIYANQKNAAYVGTLKADVTNLATAVAVRANGQDLSKTPTRISFTAAERDAFESAGNTLTIAWNATTDDYCIQGTRTVKTTNDTKWNYVVKKKNLFEGSCATSYVAF
jgi:type IV pilus assembly protein PilA